MNEYLSNSSMSAVLTGWLNIKAGLSQTNKQAYSGFVNNS
jgi:hypothetical protein